MINKIGEFISHAILCFISGLTLYTFWIMTLGTLIGDEYIMGLPMMLVLFSVFFFIPMMIVYWICRQKFGWNSKLLTKQTVLFHGVNVLLPITIAIIFSHEMASEEILTNVKNIIIITTPVQLLLGLWVVYSEKFVFEDNPTPDNDDGKWRRLK